MVRLICFFVDDIRQKEVIVYFPHYSQSSLNTLNNSQMRLNMVINWFDIVPVSGTKMRAEKQSEERFLRFFVFYLSLAPICIFIEIISNDRGRFCIRILR